MPSIAIVEDVEETLRTLESMFRARGFTIRSYRDGETALTAILNTPPDLVLLDLGLPRMHGIDVLKRIRQSSEMPVIVLTSQDTESDEIITLTLGADEFISKPYSERLLMLRVDAVLRRVQAPRPVAGEERARVLIRGKLQLDPNQQCAFWGEALIKLTPGEFTILESLATRAGHIKSRSNLLDVAYRDQDDVEERVIDTHIKRIRAKFKAVDPDFEAIQTVYGAGYSFNQPPAATI